jgi:hypothetical protein
VQEPLFERDGDRVLPTRLTAGPWDPDHCHGGAPAALLAHLVETAATQVPMATVRLTIELLRPVVRAPLDCSVQVLREGRRVQLVESRLTDGDGVAVTRCTALRIRTTEVDLPEGVDSDEPPPCPGPSELGRYVGGAQWPRGFHEALDLRVRDGRINQLGPAVAWIRLLSPVLPDTPISPLSRAAAAADFGNGVSSPLPMGPYLFINPDLTLDLHRPPMGGWIGLQAATDVDRRGTGLTTSRLYDASGRIGTGLQSLLVDRPVPA